MHEAQIALYPTGLTRKQFDQLAALLAEDISRSVKDLRAATEKHWQIAAKAHELNRLINLRLATAICDTVRDVLDAWEDIPALAHPWLAAAILYFAQTDDDEPDFLSAIGFEDDVEVLNACLRFAQRADLCLNPEDFDDV